MPTSHRMTALSRVCSARRTITLLVDRPVYMEPVAWVSAACVAMRAALRAWRIASHCRQADWE